MTEPRKRAKESSHGHRQRCARRRTRRAVAQRHHRETRGSGQLVAVAFVVAGIVRSRLLRHRDDGHRRGALRHLPLRHGGLPRVPAAGRHHDRRRPRQPEDGTRAAAGLRPDDGTEVGHLDGRLRLLGRHVQQLRDRPGRRPDRPGRRVRPRLPPDPRDADPRDRDAPRTHRDEPDPQATRRVRRRRQRPRPSSSSHGASTTPVLLGAKP